MTMILSEELVDLTTATREFPVRMSRKTIERLIRDGKLESVKISGRRYTSKEAILRFLEKSLPISDRKKTSRLQPRTGMSKTELEKRRARLKLPSPESP